MDATIRLIRLHNRLRPNSRLAGSLRNWASHRLRGAGVFENVVDGLSLRLDLKSSYHRFVLLHPLNLTVQVLRKVLRPGDVYVDGGANLGLESMVAAKRVGREGLVHAIEAAPETVRLLRENTNINGLGDTVQVHSAACSDFVGKIAFQVFPSDLDHYQSVYSRPEDEQETPDAKWVDVPAVRIDDLVDGRKVRMIKLDIEGGEFPALRGAVETIGRDRPHLLVEMHPLMAAEAGYHPIEMFDWLEGEALSGEYRFWRLGSRKIEPVDRDGLVARLDRDRSRYFDLWAEPL